MEFSIITKGFSLERIPVKSNIPWKDIDLLVSSFSNQDIIGLLSSHPSSLRLRQIKLNGSLLHVVYNPDFLPDFPENPYPSGSADSKAVYFAKNPAPPKALLLQGFNEEGDITSDHHHKETVEDYFKLHGKCFINLDGTQIELKDEFTVEPFHHHPLTALQPSLNLIVMNGPYGLSKVDHHYRR